jgi:predicted Zn-dependent protease
MSQTKNQSTEIPRERISAELEALSARVNSALEQDDLASAHDLLTDLVDACPRSVQARTMAGIVAMRLDRREDATVHFGQALELAPNDYNTNYNMALVELGRHRWDGALERFRHLRRLRPDSPDLLNDLGVVWLEKNHRGRALASFSRAMKQDPGHRMARNNAMQLCIENGLTDRAHKLLDRSEQSRGVSEIARAEIHRWREILDDPELAASISSEG